MLITLSVKWTEVSAKLIYCRADILFLWAWQVFYSFDKAYTMFWFKTQKYTEVSLFFLTLFSWLACVASLYSTQFYHDCPRNFSPVCASHISLRSVRLWSQFLLFIRSCLALFYYTCSELNKSFIFRTMERAADSYFSGNRNATQMQVINKEGKKSHRESICMWLYTLFIRVQKRDINIFIIYFMHFFRSFHVLVSPVLISCPECSHSVIFPINSSFW